MRFVTPLLRTVLYPTLSRMGAFRQIATTGLAVITYHGTFPAGYESVDAAFDGNLVSSEMLRDQIRLLKKAYRVVAPEEVHEFVVHGRELPPRAVLLTCDDGLLNCLTDMLPVMREEKVKCLFFVTGDSAGEMRATLWYEELFLIFLHAPSGPFRASCRGQLIEDKLEGRQQRRVVWWSWVHRLSQLDSGTRITVIKELRDHFGLGEIRVADLTDSVTCCRHGLMTHDELRALQSAGMTIGAHTLTHPVLSLQDPELAYGEISQSRAMLRTALGTDVWAFAYPFGDPNSITPKVLGMAEKAGYSAAFVNFGGGLGRKMPAYALPRIHVTSEMTLAEFEAHVCGFYARLQDLRSGSGIAGSLPERS